MLAPDHATSGADLQLINARANPADARAQLMLVSTLLRAKAQGLALDPAALDHAKAWLASDAGQQADASALLIKLA